MIESAKHYLREDNAVLPLYLCCFAPTKERGRLGWQELLRAVRQVALAGSLLCLLPGARLQAQDKDATKDAAGAAQPPAPAINFRERPPYPTDPQRLRRTVKIAG